ncbi:MAG: hypothetical protein LBH98_01765 [Chitinispirillales bacterium]|jgi:hypothetical protein|nr:hypothetical protein [Chitinispirillales bacterium]
MFEEMVKELDEKVDLLIDKNVQYCREIKRLQCLLDEANSRNYLLEQTNKILSGELKPLFESAENVLSHMKNAGKEE